MKERKIRILFVCTGNICRSPLAEAVFGKLASDSGVSELFEVASAGTSDYHAGQHADPRMRAVAKRHGVTMDHHRALALSEGDLRSYDLVLAMDRGNVREIASLDGSSTLGRRLCLFRDFDPKAGPGSEVPDPYYGGPQGFEEVFAIVQRTAGTLLAKLLQEGGTGPSGRE